MKFTNQIIRIYNTKTSEKEIFKPIKPGFIGIYVCGPTVYSKIHLGNLRTFLSFDLFNRYFKFLGYKVRYVRNITDAGHITDNSGNEYDRIGDQSKLEKIEPMEIVQKYTLYFHKIMNQFNTLHPAIEPIATGHIVEQIETIQKLIKQGLAYESCGSVYFDVLKYDKKYHYGKLSNRKIGELFTYTRELDKQKEKKNPSDFALWKKANPEHIQRWNSPWGEGFPGWHLECTVMSTKYLGNVFDIHGGGIDLKFPHHECELAQGIACNKKDQVNYWMHANMLTINGQKMSKSEGNSIFPDELISGSNPFFNKRFDPIIIKFCLYQAHYRSILDLSNAGLIASEKGFYRLSNSIKLLENLPISSQTSFDLNNHIKSLYDSLNDDFNSPVLIANLFEIAKLIQQIKSGDQTINQENFDYLKQEIRGFFYEVLGLNIIENSSSNQYLHGAMEVLIQIRNQARLKKNWNLSDTIRDKLSKKGIQLMDSKNETKYKLDIYKI